MCPPHYWVVPDYNSYPLKIRVLVCPMRLAPSLLMHARARSHRATHNQVPREAEAAWPVDPFLGGIGRAPNKSTRGPADSCVLPAVPVPCRYILRNVSLLLTSRRGQGGAQGVGPRALPVATPAFHGTQRKSSSPRGVRVGATQRGAGHPILLFWRRQRRLDCCV